jgi:hypothetical protein
MLSAPEYVLLFGIQCVSHKTTLYGLAVVLVLIVVPWAMRYTYQQWATNLEGSIIDCTLYDPSRLYQTLTNFAVTPITNKMGSERHRTEALCRSLLEAMLQMDLPKCRPKWLTNPTTKRALELDMYNEKNRLAFEYDGAQHDVYVPHYHQNEYHFAYRKLLDRLKTEMCRDANVLLIRIPWNDVSVSNEVQTARFLEKLLYHHGLAYRSVVSDG